MDFLSLKVNNVILPGTGAGHRSGRILPFEGAVIGTSIIGTT